MRTSAPTISLLYDKYIGPTFDIHYKYAYILTYVFMAFTWGGVVPVMFILSCWGISIMFIVERLMVYYAYSHPPMLNNDMMNQALNMLYCAPFGLCFMTSWAFSNQAVFYSKVEEVSETSVYPNTSHEFSDLFTKLNPATPLFIFAVWLFVYALTSLCVKRSDTYFEQTFQQNFSKERDLLVEDKANYMAMDGRNTYTNMLKGSQCVEMHSEMRI